MTSTLEIERQFVSLESATAPRNGAGFHPCQGLYHTPVGQRPTTAFIATHYNVDFSEHYLGNYMARRGFGFLGWNTRFRGNEAYFLLEYALIDNGSINRCYPMGILVAGHFRRSIGRNLKYKLRNPHIL